MNAVGRKGNKKEINFLNPHFISDNFQVNFLGYFLIPLNFGNRVRGSDYSDLTISSISSISSFNTKGANGSPHPF